MNSLVPAFIDQFDENQEVQAIQYIYAAAGQMYGFFTRYGFKDYYGPLKQYFKDWNTAKETIVKMAKQDPFKSDYTWMNLVVDGFIEGEVAEGKRFAMDGPSREDNHPKDQKVYITTYEDQPKGEFMRVKPSTVDKKIAQIKGMIGESLQKIFKSKQQALDKSTESSALQLVKQQAIEMKKNN